MIPSSPFAPSEGEGRRRSVEPLWIMRFAEALPQESYRFLGSTEIPLENCCY